MSYVNYHYRQLLRPGLKDDMTYIHNCRNYLLWDTCIHLRLKTIGKEFNNRMAWRLGIKINIKFEFERMA